MTRAPDIDLTLPGLNRPSNRFRVSAESKDADTITARKLMVKELSLRPGGLDILRARMDGLFTTNELHQAYLQGSDALAALLLKAREQPLFKVVEEYLAIKQSPRIRQHLESYLESQLTLDMGSVEQFLAALPVAGSTKNRYRASLSGLGSWMAKHGYIDRNPVADGGVAREAERGSRMPELTPAEWQRYLFVAGPRFAPFFQTLIHTGADVGEVLALTVADVNMQGDVPRLRFRRSKIVNANERLVPIPGTLASSLGTLILASIADKANCVKLFHFTDRDTRVAHETARKAIGRPDLRRKDFRHLAAMAWRRAGVGIETIKERLGHSSIAMTMRYAAFRPSDEFDQKGTEEAARLITG